MKTLETNKCCHHGLSEPGGVAVITLSDPERDSSFGEALCNELDSSKLNGVCRFDVSYLEQHLGDYLCGHSAALIIDSTDNGTKAGTVSLLDLGLPKDKCKKMQVPSSHGTVIASELSRVHEQGNFPDRVILLGVESPYNNRSESEATRCPLTTIAVILSTLLETLNRKSVVA
jgi:Hydrogenase maturation protease.